MMLVSSLGVSELISIQATLSAHSTMSAFVFYGYCGQLAA